MTKKAQQEEQSPQLWTEPDVQQLHQLFDEEVKSAQSADEGEALFRRFFAPKGLLEEKLHEWRAREADLDQVLKVAFELYAFKFFVFTCFFLNEYSDELIHEWQHNDELQISNLENDPSKGPVVHLRKAFDEEIMGCKTMLELEKLKEKYLSPVGVIANEFKKARSFDEKKQLQTGAALFHLKSYIEYTLFAVDFSAKSSTWTVPEVRRMAYLFEDQLKSGETEEDFRTLESQYKGDKGLVMKALEEASASKKKANAVRKEELQRLHEAIQSFFASSTTE